ncbi:DUF6624 domain-containing protein [Streptomyces sp. NPDC002564]|uniref:DUF6624 domain-containing protein n=1 Tax=Streptomyces sp. NPDC002564 TaxID=3364649 RepID=UPI0036C6567E
MTAEPLRPDIARNLRDRAAVAREAHTRRMRGLLSATEIDQGRHSDHANTQYLRRVVSEHGWPGRSLVGAEASVAAWQLVLRADHRPDFQRLVLRLIAPAVEQGEATVQQWAHLHDRCSVNSGTPQLYGTQYRLGPSGPEVLPIHDPAQLGARRSSVGLVPFAAAQEALRRRLVRQPHPGPADDPGDDDPHPEATAVEFMGSAA